MIEFSITPNVVKWGARGPTKTGGYLMTNEPTPNPVNGNAMETNSKESTAQVFLCPQ
jgi:hypothetical protein